MQACRREWAQGTRAMQPKLAEGTKRNDPRKPYWIDAPRQLRCMVSARRHDIVDRLAASGRMAVKDLARMIGAKPSALYHHVRQLVAVGLVVEAGHRVVRRKREQLYETPSPRMRLYRALQDRRNAPTFKRIVGGVGRQMERDFRRGIASPRTRTSGPYRNLGLFRLVGAPTPATLSEINAHLSEIAELMWQSPAAGTELISLAWTLAPIGKELVPAGRQRRAARYTARKASRDGRKGPRS